MPHPSKRPTANSDSHFPAGTVLAFLAERSQVDFEVDFFGKLLDKVPEFHEVLRVQASNLTAKGKLQEGLMVDKRLVACRPDDPTAHYNLACRYALLKQKDLAIATLRKSVELGYRDFRYMIADRDLESLRKDPRFRQLLKEFGTY